MFCWSVVKNMTRRTLWGLTCPGSQQTSGKGKHASPMAWQSNTTAVALQGQKHAAEGATQLTGLGNHLLALVKDSWRQLPQLVLDFLLQRRFCSTDLDACPGGTALRLITST